MTFNSHFADEALAAVKRSARTLKSKTREEKIEFLIRAGILGRDGNLLPRFRHEDQPALRGKKR